MVDLSGAMRDIPHKFRNTVAGFLIRREGQGWFSLFKPNQMKTLSNKQLQQLKGGAMTPRVTAYVNGKDNSPVLESKQP